METVVLVSQHRNQFYRRRKSHISDRFGCSPLKSFGDINCRNFYSGAGILPTPSYNGSSFPTKASSLLKTPSSYVNSTSNAKISPLSISPKGMSKCTSCTDELSYSELWAGPTYCNSPPPSSLPIPKFSFLEKRNISLDTPVTPSGIQSHSIASSAPPSPEGESLSSPALSKTRPFSRDVSATKDLRRILHLDEQ
ncbi:flocculation FLO11-like protein [Thalictrum thalictroides]|uniref:Flocculation FLO11-like protein n=1 Tax=Thalictrum thalictroides TaxID=46969 RepID=A0A7J6VDL1_THATH|nr:flocculation FLO11-like protein [Thalictrum thalictroides]